MKKLLLTLALLTAFASGQVPAPQIPLTGTIGSGGIFPLTNAGTLIFSADANRTMAYPETSAYFIKLTSSVSLTATRNLVAPGTSSNIGFAYAIENATTGGQAVQVIGATGTGVTIANGQTATVYWDGTNYVNAFPPYVSTFASLTSGTNTQAAMVIDSGASLDFADSGTINASSINGVTVTGTPSTGQVLTATGANAADWEDGGSGMVYPGAGVANSTGSAWGTSYTVGTSANDLVQLNGSAALPAVSAANLTNFPTLNQNTTGTAANLSGTPALPNGTTATTQTTGDTTTKLATDAFVEAAIPSTVANLSGGALGSAPYQSAANTTTFIASPTTASTTFLYGWQPSGSAIAPSALNFSTLLASPPAIGGTTAAAGSFTAGAFSGTVTVPTINSLSAINANATASSSAQLVIGNATSGSTPQGYLELVQNGNSSFFGMYSHLSGAFVGITPSLPGVSGVISMGGFYKGLGVAGITTNTGTPIFGVLNSSQGSYPVAFYVFDNNEVFTFNNTLDNGSGGMAAKSSVTSPLLCADTPGTTDTCLTRVSAGVMGLGNGGAGDTSGTLNLTTLNAAEGIFTGNSGPFAKFGPSAAYTTGSIVATAPSTGSSFNLFTFAAGSPDTVTLQSSAELTLASLGGDGGSIGDGTRTDIGWDGAGDVSFPATSVTFSGRHTLLSGDANNSNLDGEVQLSSGSFTFTFNSGFTIHPICAATDASGNPDAIGESYGGGPGPTDAYTVTFTGTGSDLVDYICIGRD